MKENSMNKWQSIDSARKDGTQILGYSEDKGYVIVHWEEKKSEYVGGPCIEWEAGWWGAASQPRTNCHNFNDSQGQPILWTDLQKISPEQLEEYYNRLKIEVEKYYITTRANIVKILGYYPKQEQCFIGALKCSKAHDWIPISLNRYGSFLEPSRTSSDDLTYGPFDTEEQAQYYQEKLMNKEYDEYLFGPVQSKNSNNH